MHGYVGLGRSADVLLHSFPCGIGCFGLVHRVSGLSNLFFKPVFVFNATAGKPLIDGSGECVQRFAALLHHARLLHYLLDLIKELIHVLLRQVVRRKVEVRLHHGQCSRPVQPARASPFRPRFLFGGE